jgi:hypothetical protein
MNDFEELKKLWQQPVAPMQRGEGESLKRINATHQQKLERTQVISAVMLILTAIFLIGLGFFSGLRFQSVTTYIAIVLMALISTGQATINLYMFRQLRQIDDTAPPTKHLQQWKGYYAFRKRLIRINGPLYYVLLNGAFGLYFIEILGLMPMTARIVTLSLYLSWMLFAYFYLGKRTLRREQDRLNEIIGNLHRQQEQLDSSL